MEEIGEEVVPDIALKVMVYEVASVYGAADGGGGEVFFGGGSGVEKFFGGERTIEAVGDYGGGVTFVAVSGFD